MSKVLYVWLFVCMVECYFVLGCDFEEERIVEQHYPCNKIRITHTKEKCWLLFECERKIQRIVPSDCVRNVTETVRKCCQGYKKGKQGGCEDVDECSGDHGCSSRCLNLPGSYECVCLPGHVLHSDGKTCIDVDECNDSSLHNCSHFCVNSKGSYHCTCPDGHMLDADSFTCVLEPLFTSTTNGLPILNEFLVVNLPSNISAESLNASGTIGYQLAKITLQPRMIAIWAAAGGAALIVVALLIISFVYRRHRKHWPWTMLTGRGIWKKHYGLANTSIDERLNSSVRSKVLDDTTSPGIFGIDTSRARVFKRNPFVKAPAFAVSSNPKVSVAFSTSSAVTGASSVTLMCPNVIAGSECGNRNSLDERRDGTGSSHIYCELKDSVIVSNTKPSSGLREMNKSNDAKRSDSPCYASLPISDVPLILTPVTSPSPVTACNTSKPSPINENIYNTSA